MSKHATLFAWALFMPALAFAQAYKCKQPDGSLSFQDHPCAPGSAGSQVTLRPVTGDYAEPASPRKAAKGAAHPKDIASKDGPSDYQRQLAEEQARAENERNLAYNRTVRCNAARQQLGVVNSGRPIFSYDNKGERNYVKDENRATQVAAAERKVATECN